MIALPTLIFMVSVIALMVVIPVIPVMFVVAFTLISKTPLMSFMQVRLSFGGQELPKIKDDLSPSVTPCHRHLKKGRCPGLKIYDQSELPVAGLEQTILGEGACPAFFYWSLRKRKKIPLVKLFFKIITHGRANLSYIYTYSCDLTSGR